LKNGKAQKSETAFFGCYACGHCMAICQTGAIEISGREISPDDLLYHYRIKSYLIVSIW